MNVGSHRRLWQRLSLPADGLFMMVVDPVAEQRFARNSEAAKKAFEIGRANGSCRWPDPRANSANQYTRSDGNRGASSMIDVRNAAWKTPFGRSILLPCDACRCSKPIIAMCLVTSKLVRLCLDEMRCKTPNIDLTDQVPILAESCETCTESSIESDSLCDQFPVRLPGRIASRPTCHGVMTINQGSNSSGKSRMT